MKKLFLSVLMVVFTLSAFANISVETTSPSVNPEAACTRMGQMKYIVDNNTDFTLATTTEAIILKVYLRGEGGEPVYVKSDTFDPGATTATTDDDYWAPVQLGSLFAAGSVEYSMACDSRDYFFIRIMNPGAGVFTAAPISTSPADFIVGVTSQGTDCPVFIDVSGVPVNKYVETAISDYTVDGAIVTTITAQNFDPFAFDDADTFENRSTNPAVTGVDFLGRSYQPSTPRVGIVRGTADPEGITADDVCTKPNFEPNIYLCPTYSATQTTSTCTDIYRYGDLCPINITETSLGSLKAGQTVTVSIPSTVEVYFVESMSTVTVTADSTSGLAVTGSTWGTTYTETDNSTTPPTVISSFSIADGESLTASSLTNNGSCGWSTGPTTATSALTQSFSFNITAASTASAGSGYAGGYITIDGLYVARHTSLDALEVVPLDVTVTTPGGDPLGWYRCPDCFGSFSVTIDDVATFIDCDDLIADAVPDTAYMYFPYFPAFPDGFWAGIVVNNASVYYGANYLGQTSEQSIEVTLYFVETDGDTYEMKLAEPLNAGGLWIDLIENLNPTTTSDDTAFGDEAYSVIVKATGLTPGVMVTLDGFGMMGNANGSHGYLPRIEDALQN